MFRSYTDNSIAMKSNDEEKCTYFKVGKISYT